MAVISTISEDLIRSSFESFSRAQEEIQLSAKNSINQVSKSEAELWADDIIAREDLSDVNDVDLFKECLIKVKTEMPTQWDFVNVMTARLDMETVEHCRIIEAHKKVEEDFDKEFAEVVKTYKNEHSLAFI